MALILPRRRLLSSHLCSLRVLLQLIFFTASSLMLFYSVQELLNIIASVLHLGNVQYSEEEGYARITSDTQIKYLARVRLRRAGS